MSPDADYSKIDARMRDGWKFQRTKLTGQFTYDDWRASRDGDAWPLAVLKKTGALALHSPKLPVKPEDGDILISFGAPQTAKAGTDSDKSRPPSPANPD